jgi:hypothetical protein
MLLGIPAAAEEYKVSIVGLVHSHVWGHLGTMLKGEQKDAGPGETRYRLGFRREQPPPRDCPGLRPA